MAHPANMPIVMAARTRLLKFRFSIKAGEDTALGHPWQRNRDPCHAPLGKTHRKLEFYADTQRNVQHVSPGNPRFGSGDAGVRRCRT